VSTRLPRSAPYLLGDGTKASKIRPGDCVIWNGVRGVVFGAEQVNGIMCFLYAPETMASGKTYVPIADCSRSYRALG